MLLKAASPSLLPSPILALLDQVAQKKQILVLATGVFDILHQEHCNFLQKAKEVGDVLLVGVEPDERVRAIKGDGRPINSEVKRLSQLQQLYIADQVFILPNQLCSENDFRALLWALRPAVLAVSAHTAHQELKAKLMKEIGGELRVVHSYNPALSTTQIIERDGV